ncbi:MAG: 30S ribosomal protein S15 [Candidatus Pacearchaeota archaeon]|nr:30S ribosomal protein S15 [Candidatus Pacearchaeota archaeon]
MATLYGKGRGKAGSHAPKPEKPHWLNMSAKDAEALVVDLAKKGVSVPKIGLILRDSYGVPSVKMLTGKKITKILEENNIAVEPHEIIALKKRIKTLKKHTEKNKKDMVAKRGLQLTEEKLRRLQRASKKQTENEGD